MKRFSLIPHTADIRLFVEASTLEDLFQVALEGMTHIISPHRCPLQKTTSFTLTISAPDKTILLIDFLSEVLTKIYLTKHLYCQATFASLTDTTLHAQIKGHKIEKFAEDIKAVTYHEALIVERNKLLQTTIIFDI